MSTLGAMRTGRRIVTIISAAFDLERIIAAEARCQMIQPEQRPAAPVRD
jgi:hypothetical protein